MQAGPSGAPAAIAAEVAETRAVEGSGAPTDAVRAEAAATVAPMVEAVASLVLAKMVDVVAVAAAVMA